MTWEEIRQHYPHQWLLVEAVQAHSESGRRIVDQLVVVGTFTDSVSALDQYAELHHHWPEREYFVLHTDREQLDIKERHWLGIRRLRVTTLTSGTTLQVSFPRGSVDSCNLVPSSGNPVIS